MATHAELSEVISKGKHTCCILTEICMAVLHFYFVILYCFVFQIELRCLFQVKADNFSDSKGEGSGNRILIGRCTEHVFVFYKVK